MYRLSDDAIRQIAKLLQIALLDGTDIVDHLRAVWVEPNDEGYLVPTAEYIALFEKQMQEMVETAQQIQATAPQQESGDDW
jgi:hypothetical protein